LERAFKFGTSGVRAHQTDKSEQRRQATSTARLVHQTSLRGHPSTINLRAANNRPMRLTVRDAPRFPLDPRRPSR